MAKPISESDLKQAIEDLAAARELLIPRSVTFPVDIVQEVLGFDPVGVRIELGILKGDVVGFITPVDADGKPCGGTLDSGAPCPPFCPNGG